MSTAPLIAATIGLFGVCVGLVVNGDRAERQRRREVHARAMHALVTYRHMPFRIRQRMGEPEHASAERIRLSEEFTRNKAEISVCQVLLAADGDRRVSAAYDDLYTLARVTAGREAKAAWAEPGALDDSIADQGALHRRLEELDAGIAEFGRVLAHSTLPRRARFRRRLTRNGATNRPQRALSPAPTLANAQTPEDAASTRL